MLTPAETALNAIQATKTIAKRDLLVPTMDQNYTEELLVIKKAKLGVDIPQVILFMNIIAIKFQRVFQSKKLLQFYVLVSLCMNH